METSSILTEKLNNISLDKVYQVYKDAICKDNICPKDEGGTHLQKGGKESRFELMRRRVTDGIDPKIREKIELDAIGLFRHAKSVLGHISVIEDNIINPVPIYCLCFSNDDKLIITGDNNG
jgi:hypothetical protein